MHLKKIVYLFISLLCLICLSACNKPKDTSSANSVSSINPSLPSSKDNSSSEGLTLITNIYKLTSAQNNATPDNLVGTLKFEDTEYGLLITPNLNGLSPGFHGMHIHQYPNCDSAMKDGQLVLGLAAGGHYDPDTNEAHQGPYTNNGHKGDLPVLYVDDKGQAMTSSLAPKLTTELIKQRSVIIHEGADNYSDSPKPLGGGGARGYCGVIN